MLCCECGTELPENEVLCSQCGTPVNTEDTPAEAPIAETAPVQEEVAEVSETIAEDTPAHEQAEDEECTSTEEPDVSQDTLTLLLADVKESFQLEDAETLPDEDEDETAPDENIEEAEASTYAGPDSSEKEGKKKTGKVARILVPIFAILLLAAMVCGLLLIANETYEKANECLAVKDYAQAQELYERFPFFKDSKQQAEQLIYLQQSYADAAYLVQTHAYKEALKGYAALGTYRDSQTLLATQVPYQQAVYLMDNAATGNADALAQHPGYEEGTSDTAEMLLYQGAISVFATVADYEDSAALSSQCYLHLASAYMVAERFEDALACQENMLEADAAASLAEYMTYCDDEAVLADLDQAVRARIKQESSDEELTDLEMVTAELDILGHYADEDLMFYDAELEELLFTYIDGLEQEADNTDEEGNYSDIVAWYKARSVRYTVVERLIETYDFLGDNPTLQASFAGQGAYYEAAAVLEEALAEQLLNVSAESADDAEDFLMFENTTGYKFSLSIINEFFDKDGESVFLHQTEPVPVSTDSSVRLTVLFPEDSDWETWKTSWEYTIELS